MVFVSVRTTWPPALMRSSSSSLAGDLLDGRRHRPALLLPERDRAGRPGCHDASAGTRSVSGTRLPKPVSVRRGDRRGLDHGSLPTTWRGLASGANDAAAGRPMGRPRPPGSGRSCPGPWRRSRLPVATSTQASSSSGAMVMAMNAAGAKPSRTVRAVSFDDAVAGGHDQELAGDEVRQGDRGHRTSAGSTWTPGS